MKQRVKNSDVIVAAGKDIQQLVKDPVVQHDYIEELKFRFDSGKQYYCNFGKDDNLSKKITGKVSSLVYELVCKNASDEIADFCDCREMSRISSDEVRVVSAEPQFEGAKPTFRDHFWTVVVPVITCILVLPIIVYFICKLLFRTKRGYKLPDEHTTADMITNGGKPEAIMSTGSSNQGSRVIHENHQHRQHEQLRGGVVDTDRDVVGIEMFTSSPGPLEMADYQPSLEINRQSCDLGSSIDFTRSASIKFS